MNIEQTTELYAAVLRQLLPTGGYDPSPGTVTAKDVYAHAKLFAQADMNAKRILSVLETIPPELIAEYENAHGLPLKCSTNISRTFEERLEILNWVRNTKNVLNRAYLTQLMKIFGVVLVELKTYRPLQCTAPCTSALNTEQLRYKVLLRLEYPLIADIECIIENYLPSYLRVDWIVDMPWTWFLYPELTTTYAGTASYQAYKTNDRITYDSYADYDLLNAVVRSLHDEDFQQWQAVKDACNELTGINEWIFDNSIASIKFNSTRLATNADEYFYTCQLTGFSACTGSKKWRSMWIIGEEMAKSDGGGGVTGCTLTSATYGYCLSQRNRQLTFYVGKNSNYDPNAAIPWSFITYQQIAQKIIANTSAAEPVSLHAENYLLNVARSINSADESKQFVKMSELYTQLEENIYRFGATDVSVTVNSTLETTWKGFGYPASYNYYRSKAPMSVEAMPVAKAKGIKSPAFNEAILETGKNYFRIGAIKNGVEKFSEEFSTSVAAPPDGMWALAVACWGTSSLPQFNKDLTTEATWNENFLGTQNFISYRRAYNALGNLTTQSISGAILSVTLLKRRFELVVAASTYKDNYGKLDITFFDANNNVIAAVRVDKALAGFGSTLQIGSNFENLSNVSSTGTYPTANGYLDITATGITYTPKAGGYNAYTFNVDMTKMKKIRLSNLEACQTHSKSATGSPTGSAAYVYLKLLPN